ncbi:MAG: hypothetical protein OEZ59_09155 [Deltaproteobacteria bacterium]|nr:hypothetical protein [Deltaproteobacteria bacterium]
MNASDGNQTDDPPPGRPGWRLTRRQALALALLALAPLLATRCTPRRHTGRDTRPELSVLTPDEAGLIRALAPVFLDGLLPPEPALLETHLKAAVRGVDRLLNGFSPAYRAEVRQMFTLMNSSPGRLVLTGQWTPWDQAPREEAWQSLDRLRTSNIELKRRIFQGLHQLITGGWLGSEEAWPLLGYDPGPQIARPSRPWETP